MKTTKKNALSLEITRLRTSQRAGIIDDYGSCTPTFAPPTQSPAFGITTDESDLNEVADRGIDLLLAPSAPVALQRVCDGVADVLSAASAASSRRTFDA